MSETTAHSNIPEFSVSDLAFSLKKTLEDSYGRVRVRGELSRVSIPRSGHMYTGLKDDKCVLDAVCWKGMLPRLSVRPEEGLEVICTGKITTYPMSSKYQLIIETMELAGEGALLKMLEERKKKLAAEGLFAAERKRPVPFLPQKVGVVTSPTGAVIRDILHRLSDRFPRHVMVWPVKVQGAGADQEIAAAIDGFNALPEGKRPDLLIVARGGGSLEDLMPFNEENVVRATARSIIPIISAVGHETDTTLIDYAADLRAPTPTGAAEKAVPVRMELSATVKEGERRLIGGIGRALADKRSKLDTLSAKLGDPARLLEIKTQNLDRISDRMEHRFQNLLSNKRDKFTQQSLRLTHPAQLIETKRTKLDTIAARQDSGFKHYIMRQTNNVDRAAARLSPPKAQIKEQKTALLRWYDELERATKQILREHEKHVKQTEEKLELLSFKNVLKRGYVVVRDENGRPVTTAGNLQPGMHVDLEFKDNQNVGAQVTAPARQKPQASKKASASAPSKKAKETSNSAPPPTKQGNLF